MISVMLVDKVLFTPSLLIACKYLKNKNIDLPKCIYGDRVVINHYKINDISVIRLWKTKSFFDLWYDNMTNDNFIAGIDYSIQDDHIKIEFMDINDENCIIKNSYKLDKKDSMMINNALVRHMKIIARENNKNKIVVDVHNNLKIFGLYYKDEGFISTSRKSHDNPFWVEAELQL